MRTPASTRRARIDRWVASLTPLYSVIAKRAAGLELGAPTLEIGPVFMAQHAKADESTDKVRRGAVWFVDGKNTGFHVDFMAARIVYEAWTTERRVTISVAGKASEATVDRDLSAALLTAGLSHIGKLQAARDQILPVTRRKPKALDR